MNTNDAAGLPECRWCTLRHAGRCATTKAIEYYPDGSVKRIEFYTPADYPASIFEAPSRGRLRRDVQIT